MLSQDVLYAVPAQRLAANICEHRIGGLAIAFPQPMAQCATSLRSVMQRILRPLPVQRT